jgi:ectoine hydroxylase-related dioxygenase (phytanoyl-CoA dioxygenase family)
LLQNGTRLTRNGFAIFPTVLSRADLQPLIVELVDVPLQRTRAGARHILGLPSVSRLANDPRLVHLASEWLGGAAIPFKATLFDKRPEANWLVAWHQDTALPMVELRETVNWGPWSEKAGVLYAHAPAHVLDRVVALRVHLDDSTADNGPLRVLPGTHTLGVLTDAQIHEISLRVQHVTCATTAGGVVVIRPLIIHASPKLNDQA